MPELPEVETVVRQVRPGLVGGVLTGAEVSWERTLGGQTSRALRRAVTGARVQHVGRRGKHIVIELARERRPVGALLIHLRMTGRLLVEPGDAERSPYLRVSCPLESGARLDFVDVRKFGRFRFVRDPEDVLDVLGPEPLGDAFTSAWLRTELRGRKRRLKPLLLDQTFLAGLGNIYVDECLFRARLHPELPAHRVSSAKAEVLHGAIRSVLADAIEREGSSFDTFYRTPAGQPGSYQHQFQVYARDGQPCPRCGRVLRKLVVAQRGTHICATCQRRPRG